MILVTGGTGLLGSRLIYDLVRSGEEVRAIKRPTSDLATIKNLFNYYSSSEKNLIENIEWVDGDVTDMFSLLEAMENVTKVYHCAAMVSFNPKARDKMMKVNIEGTANIVNACLEKGIEKLCYASSVAAIGNPVLKKPGLENGPAGPGRFVEEITENTPWVASTKNSNYTISKYASEQEVWRGIEEGLNAVIVNPSIIIGPGNWRKSSANMFPRVWKGLKYYTTGINGFVDVRDVSTAMISLMNSEMKSDRFIITSENLPFKKVFDRIAEFLGKKRAHKKISPLLIEVLWRTEKIRSWITGSKPFITKEIAREASLQHFYSNKKIKQAIDLEFIPIDRAIKDTADFFLKEMKETRKEGE